MAASECGEVGQGGTESASIPSGNSVKLSGSDKLENYPKKVRPKAPPKPRKFRGAPSASQVLLEENEETDETSKLYSNDNVPVIMTMPSNYPSYSLPREHTTSPLFLIPNESPSPYRATTLPLNGHNSTRSNTNGISSNGTTRSVDTSPKAGVVLNQMSNNNSRSATLPAASNRGEYRQLRRVGHLRGKVLTDSYKVIAFICGLFAAILLVMGLASSEWLIASGYRQGLFVYCVGKNETEATVPFVSSPEQATEGCHRIDLNMQAYTLVAAAFCVVSLLVDVFATLLTVLGLRCRDPNKKYKYYRIAVYVMALALVTALVALVVYPVCFAQIMDGSKRPFWEFGWAYGVGWGASIFLFGGVILLLCDKESEEIYYKERTIVQYADTNNKV